MRSIIPFVIAAAFVCACQKNGKQPKVGSGDPKTPAVLASRTEPAPASPMTGCSEEKVWRIGFPGTPPVVIKRVDPHIDADVQPVARGVVIVEAIIDRTGSVCAVSVVRSVSPDIDRAVVAAVKEWKFTPATLNGEPQQVAYNVAVPVGP